MRARLVTIIDITIGGNASTSDAVRLHRRGYDALFDVAEALGVGRDLAANGFAMVRQGHELHEQPGTVSAVEPP